MEANFQNQIALAACIQAWATVTLVIVTATYVFITWKMAKAAVKQAAILKKDYDSRIMPIYDTELSCYSVGGTEIKLRVRVINKGVSTFKLRFVSLRFCRSDDPNIVRAEPISFDSFIMPGKEIYLDEPLLFDISKYEGFANIPDARNKIYIQYYFQFRDLNGAEHRFPENAMKLLIIK